MQRPKAMKPVKKKRTTISITEASHTMGLALARLERRDFSSMLENAIEERWKKLQQKEEVAA